MVDFELLYDHCTFGNIPGCSLPPFRYATPNEVTSHSLMSTDRKWYWNFKDATQTVEHNQELIKGL